MSQTLVFATNNAHKIAEIQPLLPSWVQLKTLQESGFFAEIDEPYNTLEENAAEKCRVVQQALQKDCFAEDSGLFVDALGGAPGVHSARYAAGPRSDAANVQKLLGALDFEGPVTARFITVIALWYKQNMHYFKGVCEGKIVAEPVGTAGFGYDPVFVPDGAQITFAQMDASQKALYSHRAKAVAAFLAFFTHTL